MYDAAASSRSAVPAARLSIASEPCRPFSRTDEAAECRALPVWSIPRSNFLAADRLNSSTESPPPLPHSGAVFLDVLKIVMMLLQSGNDFPVRAPTANTSHVGLHCQRKSGDLLSQMPQTPISPRRGAKDTKILHWGEQFLPPRRPSDRGGGTTQPAAITAAG